MMTTENNNDAYNGQVTAPLTNTSVLVFASNPVGLRTEKKKYFLVWQESTHDLVEYDQSFAFNQKEQLVKCSLALTIDLVIRSFT